MTTKQPRAVRLLWASISFESAGTLCVARAPVTLETDLSETRFELKSKEARRCIGGWGGGGVCVGVISYYCDDNVNPTVEGTAHLNRLASLQPGKKLLPAVGMIVTATGEMDDIPSPVAQLGACISAPQVKLEQPGSAGSEGAADDASAFGAESIRSQFQCFEKRERRERSDERLGSLSAKLIRAQAQYPQERHAWKTARQGAASLIPDPVVRKV